MLATALTSFTTFFATIGPIEAAVSVRDADADHASIRSGAAIAFEATLIATGILASATLAGGPLLRQLGVSIPALADGRRDHPARDRLEMVFARPTSAFKLTPPEGVEAQTKDDLAVFPSGDAAARRAWRHERRHPARRQCRRRCGCISPMTVAALAAVMVATLVLLLLAHEVTQHSRQSPRSGC